MNGQVRVMRERERERERVREQAHAASLFPWDYISLRWDGPVAFQNN